MVGHECQRIGPVKQLRDIVIAACEFNGSLGGAYRVQ